MCPRAIETILPSHCDIGRGGRGKPRPYGTKGTVVGSPRCNEMRFPSRRRGDGSRGGRGKPRPYGAMGTVEEVRLTAEAFPSQTAWR
jgi:hypothetical protein